MSVSIQEKDTNNINANNNKCKITPRVCKFCGDEFKQGATYFFVYGILACSCCWYEQKKTPLNKTKEECHFLYNNNKNNNNQ